MRNKKGFLNLNNRGFAITSIIYSMLLLFIILMTITILTLGRRKVLLDKTRNETLGFFSQLANYPCMVAEKNSDEIAISVGDVVACGTENFYVISNDGTNIEMLAKYNLNVGDNKVDDDKEGIQSSKVPGFVTGGTEPYSGTVEFSNTNYWSSNTTYTTFVYDKNSTLYQYIENYAIYLRNILETQEINASLINYDKMIELGCNITNNSCENAPDWLHLVSYWTGSAYSSTNMWGMNSSGTFGNAQYSRDNIYGVRPVVSIPVDKIKNDVEIGDGPVINDFTVTAGTVNNYNTTSVTLTATVTSKVKISKYEFYNGDNLLATIETSNESASTTINTLSTNQMNFKVIVYDQYNRTDSSNVTESCSLNGSYTSGGYKYNIYKCTPTNRQYSVQIYTPPSVDSACCEQVCNSNQHCGSCNSSANPSACWADCKPRCLSGCAAGGITECIK